MSEQDRLANKPESQIDQALEGSQQIEVSASKKEPTPSGFAWGGTFIAPRPDDTPKQLENVREQLNRLRNRQS